MPETEHRVSFIMAVYNCASTLDAALQSLIDQTFQDWDMVICDDGSTDNSQQRLEKWVETYPDRFRLIRCDVNYGTNYALNRCLELTHSEYIAIMDADDISLPQRLERELQFLDDHPEYALVSCSLERFDEHGIWGRADAIAYPEPRDFFSGDAVFCHGAALLRLEALRAVGCYTASPQTIRVEDRDLWFKLYAAGYRGANLTEVLYRTVDDRSAAKRRTWQNRVNCCRVFWHGLHLLHAPWYRYLHALKYSVRELLLGLTPLPVYRVLHRMKNQFR